LNRFRIFYIYIGLFAAISVLCSFILLPVAWTFLQTGDSIEKTDWAAEHAWQVHQLIEKVKKQPLTDRNAILLEYSGLLAGQFRLLGPSGAILLATRTGAAPRNFEPWPTGPKYHEWREQNTRSVLTGWPPQIMSYLQEVQSEPRYLILKANLSRNETIRDSLLVRVAIPSSISVPWSAGLRYGLAIALSLGLVFALFWVIRIVRPEERMAKYVELLKQGDLGASLPKDLHGLSSTGAAIADLSFHLRQRVAVAHEVNTVLYQFVEALPLAVMVWDGDGEMQTTNGLARRLFSFHHLEGEEQAAAIFKTPMMQKKIRQAEQDAEPVSVEVALVYPREIKVTGWVHVLKRPKEKAFITFVGHDILGAPPRLLTTDDRVEPQKFYKVWRRVNRLVKPLLKRTNKQIAVPEILPEESIAEVQHRLYWALSIVVVTFSAMRNEDELTMETEVLPHAIQVRFSAGADLRISHLLKIIIAPIGGRVSVEEEEVVLWLPRA